MSIEEIWTIINSNKPKTGNLSAFAPAFAPALGVEDEIALALEVATGGHLLLLRTRVLILLLTLRLLDKGYIG